jgi:hypothetical protein
LCTETPRAGGRVFETGDEKLLKLARTTESAFLTTTTVVLLRHDGFIFTESAPIVVVFTKYDRLVRTKKAELKEDEEDLSPDELDRKSREEAKKALDSFTNSDSVKRAMGDTRHVKVSSMISHFFFDQR